VSDIAESSARLIAATYELDQISKYLVQVEKHLEVQEPEIEDMIEGYLVALHEECEEAGKRLPPEDIRKALAGRSVTPELRRAYRQNIAVRRRCKSRLSDLREIVAAHRSIVSAAKTEVEASEGPQPHWTGG
jgi:hypothetical protein